MTTQTDTDPVVDTTSGRLRGRTARGVSAFRGVPYAAAPTGSRRFRAPAAYAPHPGVLDASRPGPAAPQRPSRLEPAVGPMHVPAQDEDCLTLDVWAPADGASGPRPVLVWLHGGAFVAGSGSQPWYDGARLAREQDAVVVTANHRLGVLGYLYDEGAANLGLLDQLAALRWVRDTIAAFGGDPGSVAVAGQSSGAQSILAMLHREDVAGVLFHRAVLQSAPLGLPPLAPDEAARRTALLGEELGLDRPTTARLRDVPVDALLDAQGAVTRRESRPLHLGPAFQLVADGAAVPPDLLDLRSTRVPVVLTTTAHEADAFTVPDSGIAAMTPDDLRAALRPLLGAATDERFLLDDTSPARTASDLVTAHYFHDDLEPLAARLRDGSDADVRVVAFDWHPPASPLRAAHCIDLPFTFGNLEAWRASPLLHGASHAELEDRYRSLEGFRRLLVHGPDGADPGVTTTCEES